MRNRQKIIGHTNKVISVAGGNTRFVSASEDGSTRARNVLGKYRIVDEAILAIAVSLEREYLLLER